MSITMKKAVPVGYAFSVETFNNAINNAVLDSLFFPLSLGSRCLVKIKKDFKTACWCFKTPTHHIYVGDSVLGNPNVRKELSPKELQEYIESFVHHEFGHAFFTERDLVRMNVVLSENSIPFQLYNLFEDAYIEHRYRREMGRNFNWLNFEENEPKEQPASILFGFIQAEGDGSLVVLSDNAANAHEMGTLKERVYEYYVRIVACERSQQLIPILREWIFEFGAPPDSKDKSDLQQSMELSQDDSKHAEFDADTVSVEGKKPAPPEVKAHSQIELDGKPQEVKGEDLGSGGEPVDTVRALALAGRFSKLFETKSRYVRTDTPTKKVSARHAAIGRSPFQRKESLGKTKMKVFIEVDCSGSMSGDHIEEGKLLLTALSLLAIEGRIEGHVVLSGVVNRKVGWSRYSLPMKQEEIDDIVAYCGAEGLEPTLKDNMKYAKAADFVFVYTDAQICDVPINKAYFRAQGVFTWGLYVGDESEFLPTMLTYFDKAVMRKTAEELVDAILSQIN